ncbi:hypothetical protein QPK32_23340 [Massilia sp. YIM B02763]|uniref:hypothetical protein n=1 Tax=Massilia sp. YIM B02763 TaxID=3050130 RepID=UPI0025B6A605|nr:hypothetical protein [Massilia sp. YIM B02763]MDN4056005.1 hypothetical protein [Massilia sp. YIM B02763]
MKGFFYASITHAEARAGLLSPGTVQLDFRRIRVLCNWMIEKGKWRFSSLTASDVMEFLEIRLFARRSGCEDSGTVTQSSIGEYYGMLKQLWILRDQYVAPLQIDVERLVGLPELMARAMPNKIWAPVELTMAKKLLRWALSTVERSAPVEDALAEIWASRKRWVGTTRNMCKQEFRKLLLRVDARYSEQFVVGDALGKTRLQSAIRNLEGAILLIILFFTGMRISEVLTLQTNCLVTRQHADGIVYCYLKGPGAKRKGRERLWVVPDVIADVVRLQIRLFAPIRELHKVSMLFPRQFDAMRILTGRFKPHALTGAGANLIMREAIGGIGNNLCDLSSSFHAHRARKTFARFVVMRDKSALESLAHHYGHVYAAILDRHYVGNDFRLEELIRTEDIAELREGLTKLLTAANIGGKAGERMMMARERIAASPALRGKVTLDGVVENLVKNGLILAPCDWGYCVYAREQSKCKGNANGPNPILRAPSVCASCTNFAVADHHLPWWERRHVEQSKFLSRPGLPEQTKRVVSEQLAMTEKVLSSVIRQHAKEGMDE